MRTSTEFIGWISAPTISTSFDFQGGSVMCTFLCPDISVDHYVLFCPDP